MTKQVCVQPAEDDILKSCMSAIENALESLQTAKEIEESTKTSLCLTIFNLFLNRRNNFPTGALFGYKDGSVSFKWNDASQVVTHASTVQELSDLLKAMIDCVEYNSKIQKECANTGKTNPCEYANVARGA